MAGDDREPIGRKGRPSRPTKQKVTRRRVREEDYDDEYDDDDYDDDDYDDDYDDENDDIDAETAHLMEINRRKNEEALGL